MKKESKKSKSAPFERKSRFNDNRDSYVDENGNYIYIRWVEVGKNKWKREVVASVPFSEETKDIIIMLDENDYRCDLQERYDDENADYGIRNLQIKALGDSDAEDEFDCDPLDTISAANSAPEEILFSEKKPENTLVTFVEDFVREKLTPAQQNLFFAHYGELRFLEDIRREEETVTGKHISKQAMHNRLTKILERICKELGVERPKQKHKKADF